MYGTQVPKSSLVHSFQILYSFLLLWSLWILGASSTYDPRRRHLRENFDPAEADPKRNVSCVGGSYDLKLPILEDGFNPRNLSMQELCVKPQYGGGKPHRHAGAYCFNPIEPDRSTDSDDDSGYIDNDIVEYEPPVMLGKVVFDPHRGAQTSRELRSGRIRQACVYRCFCNYGIEDVSIQPESDHFPIQQDTTGYRHGYQMAIDIWNDVKYAYKWEMGVKAPNHFDIITISEKPQVDAHIGSYFAQSTFLSLDPRNKITCTGDLPTFVLTSPYSRNDFSSVQELCAVALSGGNK